jgi:hypothetical protein
MPQAAGVTDFVHHEATIEERTRDIQPIEGDHDVVGERPVRASALALHLFNDEHRDREAYVFRVRPLEPSGGVLSVEITRRDEFLAEQIGSAAIGFRAFGGTSPSRIWT